MRQEMPGMALVLRAHFELCAPSAAELVPWLVAEFIDQIDRLVAKGGLHVPRYRLRPSRTPVESPCAV